MGFFEELIKKISNIQLVEGCFQKKIYNQLEDKMEEVDERKILSFFIENEIHFMDIFLKNEIWKPSSIYHYGNLSNCKDCVEYNGMVVCCKKYEPYIEDIFNYLIKDRKIRLKMITNGIHSKAKTGGKNEKIYMVAF